MDQRQIVEAGRSMMIDTRRKFTMVLLYAETGVFIPSAAVVVLDRLTDGTLEAPTTVGLTFMFGMAAIGLFGLYLARHGAFKTKPPVNHS